MADRRVERMTTQNRMQQLLLDRGYTIVPDPGFVSGWSPDHTTVSLFTWGNDDAAEQSLAPRKYLVIRTKDGRWRLPTVEWERFRPISEQHARRWATVAEEFDEVFLPALRGKAPMPPLDDERYGLVFGLPTVFEDLGFSLTQQKAGHTTFERPGAIVTTCVEGRDFFERVGVIVTTSVTGRVLTVTNAAGEARLELTPEMTWADVSVWLRGQDPPAAAERGR